MHPDLIHDFDLSGRVAVVTGAASGIGRETAIVLAQAGATVALADLNQDGLTESVQLVEAVGGTASPHIVDIASRPALESLAESAGVSEGRLDVWVNAAGILDSFSILDAAEEDVERVLAVNLKGTYWGCAAAGRVMKARGGGSIINISSAAADNPLATLSAYAISKAGMNMLTRVAAKEFGSFGCRVNAIAPGFVDTAMGSSAYLDSEGRVDPDKREAFLKDRARATPLNITGRPRDVALAVLYLASDASRFVTGQVLRPNGGTTMP